MKMPVPMRLMWPTADKPAPLSLYTLPAVFFVNAVLTSFRHGVNERDVKIVAVARDQLFVEETADELHPGLDNPLGEDIIGRFRRRPVRVGFSRAESEDVRGMRRLEGLTL
jgi:hypothetical protein